MSGLGSPLPTVAVHYASGPPFCSMMALDDAGRDAVVRAGCLSGPERFSDPLYVQTRRRVEATLFDGFVAAGGQPLQPHPHYALIGRSARVEAAARPGKRAYLLRLDRLPSAQVSFTWGDSFTFDAVYRAAMGVDHPACGRVFRLEQLPEVLDRWGPGNPRPAWQELELQLWFTPRDGEYDVVELVPR